MLRGFTRRLEGVLRSRGTDEDAEDPLPVEQPLLAEIYGAAATGRVACGPRRGKRLRRLGDRIAIERIEEADVPGCVSAGGFGVHAAVPANDRQRLGRLCRYAARPPLALARQDWRDDGSLVFYVEPNTENSKRVSTNTARTNLLIDNQRQFSLAVVQERKRLNL